MKLNIITKTIPFLSTLILIIFLYFSNQKVNTRLRILIWNTPSYSLGTYLAASTGLGFIFAYILTTNLANINKFSNINSFKYENENNNEDITQYENTSFFKSEEKTLIERDINDPSPTVNAQFRVIGKIERNVDNRINYEHQNDYEKSNFEQDNNNESFKRETQTLSDWNDDSFSNW